MPNRKASRNAFYFFVQEKMPELRRQGLSVSRVADAAPYCSSDWMVRPAGRAGSWAGGRPGGGKEASRVKDPGACWGRRSVPSPGPSAPEQPPGASGRRPTGPGTRTSPLLLPFRPPPQSPQAPEGGREEEVHRNGSRVEGRPQKGPGAGKESGKIGEEQLPARRLGLLSEWADARGLAGDSGQCREKPFIFVLLSKCLLKQAA